jgi:uncharacterized GH25 family protein
LVSGNQAGFGFVQSIAEDAVKYYTASFPAHRQWIPHMKHNINKGDTYVCSVCEELFKSAWNAEDANAQFAKEFPDSTGKNTSIVCQDCYDQYLKWKKSGSKARSVN